MIPTTRNTLAKIDGNTLQALSAVSVNAANAFAVATSQTVDVAAALAVADAIQDMRSLFDRPEVRQRIESLMDTPLGFRTDSDPKVFNKKKNKHNEPYDWVIVREASIEAMLRGLQLVGNQFNIIAGRFYGTKEGFEFLIPKVKGLSEFRPELGVPRSQNGGAIVECVATWKINGREDSAKASIPVKTDEYSGADQILGKAKRKFLARCYSQMCGASVPEGEAGEVGELQIEAVPSVAERLTRPVGRPPKPTAPPEPVKPPAPPVEAPPVQRRPGPVLQGSLLSDEPDPYAILELAINRSGTLADFVAAVVEDNLIGTTPPDSIRSVSDIPMEIVRKYAGRNGDYAPVKESMEYVISQRKGVAA